MTISNYQALKNKVAEQEKIIKELKATISDMEADAIQKVLNEDKDFQMYSIMKLLKTQLSESIEEATQLRTNFMSLDLDKFDLKKLEGGK